MKTNKEIIDFKKIIHNHPLMEQELGVNRQHLIIDKKVFKKLEEALEKALSGQRKEIEREKELEQIVSQSNIDQLKTVWLAEIIEKIEKGIHEFDGDWKIKDDKGYFTNFSKHKLFKIIKE